MRKRSKKYRASSLTNLPKIKTGIPINCHNNLNKFCVLLGKKIPEKAIFKRKSFLKILLFTFRSKITIINDHKE